MATTRTSSGFTTQQLAQRVRGEFMEMPGLRLTVPQAQRLWALDSVLCEAVLNALVDVGCLTCTDGVFALRSSEP